jgi:ABC-2 type transport system ATP-binding protein
LNLCVRQLSKAFGSQWALLNVNFELRPGDCVALLGPNGAGKTTLLKILCALMQPTSGAIEFDGASAPSGALSRALVGYFVPGSHFYDHLTARENLRLFTSLYGKKTAGVELDDALDRVGLLKRGDEFVAALSSGMKCRLVIAKWMLLDPGLLLFDEPYGPLDGRGIDLLEAFVAGMVRSQKTVMIATHQVPRVLNLCPRALILNQGKMVFDGACRDATANLMDTLLPEKSPWTS